VKRGEIWTVSGGNNYAGKPRPAVIVQEDRFDGTSSITVCAFTTDPTDAPLIRLRITPGEQNGLRAECRLMIDKITTVPKTRLGRRLGQLDDTDQLRVNRALMVFLGLARSAEPRN
jgi:mRNA interferase MazF